LERDQIIQVGRLRGIEKFEGEIENFILNTFINFKPVKRFVRMSSLLDGIALAALVIPPIPTHFSVAWSVCLSSVCHIRAPFKSFGGFRCHLAGILERSNLPGRGRFGGQTPQLKHTCKVQLPRGEYKRAIPPFVKLLWSVFGYVVA